MRLRFTERARRVLRASAIRLAQRLLERYPTVRIGFTGAPDEADAVQRLVDGVGSPRCACKRSPTA